MLRNKIIGRVVMTAVFVLACLAVQAHATPLDIDSFALYAGKTLSVGHGVTVNAPIAAIRSVSLGNEAKAHDIYTEGGVYIGKSSQVKGDLWANGNVRINNKAMVGGDVNVVGKYWKHKGATVAGTVRQGKEAVSIELPIFGATPDVGIVSPMNILKNPTKAPRKGRRMAPAAPAMGRIAVAKFDSGRYLDRKSKSKDTLNFSAGTYTMKNFWMDTNGVVNADTSSGDVILNVHGDFSTGNNVKFNTIGDGSLFINVLKENVWLGSKTEMDAVVCVYNGGFKTGSNVALTGSFHARGNVWLGNNSQVRFTGGGGGGGGVPEPATVILLIAGGGLCILRRRKRLGRHV